MAQDFPAGGDPAELVAAPPAGDDCRFRLSLGPELWHLWQLDGSLVEATWDGWTIDGDDAVFSLLVAGRSLWILESFRFPVVRCVPWEDWDAFCHHLHTHFGVEPGDPVHPQQHLEGIVVLGAPEAWRLPLAGGGQCTLAAHACHVDGDDIVFTLRCREGGASAEPTFDLQTVRMPRRLLADEVAARLLAEGRPAPEHVSVCGPRFAGLADALAGVLWALECAQKDENARQRAVRCQQDVAAHLLAMPPEERHEVGEYYRTWCDEPPAYREFVRGLPRRLGLA